MKPGEAEAVVAGTRSDPFALHAAAAETLTSVGTQSPFAAPLAPGARPHARDGRGEPPVAIADFPPRMLTGCRLTLPGVGVWHQTLNTHAHAAGGSGAGNSGGTVAAEDGGAVATTAPRATIMFEHSR